MTTGNATAKSPNKNKGLRKFINIKIVTLEGSNITRS
jgi:hypothetical protein